MLKLGRRELLLGGAALVAIGGGALSSCNSGAAAGPGPDDIAIGAENAPVTLIEYASSTCPHCAEFHTTVFERFKENYIDTGKVRFVFREFPTDPAAVAVAGFQVARCGGVTPEQYFTRLGVLFEQQRAMFASGSMEGVRQKLIDIGAASGLSQDQVMTCINDPAGAERIRRNQELGRRDGVTGTPNFVLNGRLVEDPEIVTYEGLSRIVDAAIAGA